MNNVKKIVIHCTTNTVGTDSWEFVEVDANSTPEELDSLSQEYALSNAEMYGIYPPHDEYTDEEETEDEIDDSISGCWYEYIPDKHDMYTCSGIPAWHSI